MDIVELTRLWTAGFSSWKIAEQLGASQTNVRYHLTKLGLVKKKPEKVVKFCPGCGTGIKSANTYCSNKCKSSYELSIWIKRWLERTLSPKEETHGRTKRALIHLFGNKCQRCGWCEVNLVTGIAPIELEHENGDWKDNSPDNVLLLCPCCHAITPTYKALNWGRGRNAVNGDCKLTSDKSPMQQRIQVTRLALVAQRRQQQICNLL
jgi:hypothetical protein